MDNTNIKTFLENSSMYIIQKKDIKSCAKLMARAFSNDPSIRYLLCGEKEGKNDWKYFYALIKSLYGRSVMISSDAEINDFVFLLPPSQSGVPAIPFLLDGGFRLPFLFRRGLLKRSYVYEVNCQTIKSRFIDKDTWYLMAIVVNPNMQGQGRGGKLLNYMTENLSRMDSSVYLETHKEVNVKIYQKHNFEVKDISTIPNTTKTQYAMLWNPKK